MTTNIVESIDLSLSIPAQDKLIAGNVEFQVVPSLAESRLMRDEHPSSGEDRSSLELVHVFRRVPARWQGPDWAFRAGLGYWRGASETKIVEDSHLRRCLFDQKRLREVSLRDSDRFRSLVMAEGES